MLVAVGVREHGRAAQHGGAQNVNPRRECHVERGVNERLGQIRYKASKIELLYKRNHRLEMLVPGDIGKSVLRTSNDALEENQAKGSIKNWLMVLIAVERLAQPGDGGIAVAHDVVVDILTLNTHRRLVVLRRNAQAAVQVALVVGQRWENELRAD